MEVNEFVYNGRDNIAEWQLVVDGVPIDHTGITRAQLLVNGTIILDSNTSPTLFDFSNTDRMKIKLGMASLTNGHQVVNLVVYDATTTNGYRWDSDIHLQVK